MFCGGVVLIDRTNREVKRYGNSTLSPVLTNLSETVAGRAVIQATGLGPYFQRKHWRTMDAYMRFTYFSTSLINLGTLNTRQAHKNLLIAFGEPFSATRSRLAPALNIANV